MMTFPIRNETISGKAHNDVERKFTFIMNQIVVKMMLRNTIKWKTALKDFS